MFTSQKLLRVSIGLFIALCLFVLSSALHAKPDTINHRFIGGEPILPLGKVVKGKIESTNDKKYCLPWADKQKTWQALDAYGQIIGDTKISSMKYNDMTDCYELALAPIKNKLGANIFVDKSSSFLSPTSRKWVPTGEEMKKLAELINRLEQDSAPQMVGSIVDIKTRTLFFTITVSSENKDVLLNYAVVGGPLLTIVRYDDQRHRWFYEYIDLYGVGLELLPYANAYQPTAVFDMNGDGMPEIVYHHDRLISFSDMVLQLEQDSFGARWKIVSETLGGSTK